LNRAVEWMNRCDLLVPAAFEDNDLHFMTAQPRREN
jgi:hypothetical protein